MTDILAETLTEIMEQRQDNFVTKTDLKAEFAQLRMELSELRTELNSRMDRMENSLNSRMDKIENNLNWLKGIGFIIVGLLVKIALFS